MIQIRMMIGKATILNKRRRRMKSPKKENRCSLPFHFSDFALSENIGISETNNNEKTIDNPKIIKGFEITGSNNAFVDINCGKSGEK